MSGKSPCSCILLPYFLLLQQVIDWHYWSILSINMHCLVNFMLCCMHLFHSVQQQKWDIWQILLLTAFLARLDAFYFTQVSYMSLFCFIQATDLAGLLHLVKFYKSRRFDADIGMPRSRSALCITCFPCCKLLCIIAPFFVLNKVNSSILLFYL